MIVAGGELLRSNLEDVIRTSAPLAAWHVSETPCGLIAAFTREADAEKILQQGDLARVFQGPVQVSSLHRDLGNRGNEKVASLDQFIVFFLLRLWP